MQHPQGGIQSGEQPEEALFRELREETGLVKKDVRIVAVTEDWLRYQLPAHFKRDKQSRFVGQKRSISLCDWYQMTKPSSSTVNKSRSSMIGVGQLLVSRQPNR